MVTQTMLEELEELQDERDFYKEKMIAAITESNIAMQSLFDVEAQIEALQNELKFASNN